MMGEITFTRSEIATLAAAADEFRDEGVPELADRLNAALRAVAGDSFAVIDAARIAELEGMIQAEHSYKASVGGAPCVCEICGKENPI